MLKYGLQYNRAIHFLFLIMTSILFLRFSHAQEADSGLSSEDRDLNQVEQVLEKNIPNEILPPEPTIRKAPKKADFNVLQNVESYKDLASIQRIYMPKTERFQISGSIGFQPNDVFYNVYGAQLGLTYHFNEAWGFELYGKQFTSGRSEANTKLEDVQRTGVENLSSVKSILGAQIYISYLYGKFAWLDDKIIPYDIYQTVGFGKVTDQNSKTYDAFTASLGQMFSVTRSNAFKIDLSMAYYNAETRVQNITSTSGKTQKQNILSIFLFVGWSYFLPEPTYR
jgi:outer membrane beta-barrel protein